MKSFSRSDNEAYNKLVSRNYHEGRECDNDYLNLSGLRDMFTHSQCFSFSLEKLGTVLNISSQGRLFYSDSTNTNEFTKYDQYDPADYVYITASEVQNAIFKHPYHCDGAPYHYWNASYLQERLKMWEHVLTSNVFVKLGSKGKENGVNILKLIDEGPFQMGTFRETIAEGTKGALHLGLPKDIYSLINHYTDAKDIWDNVKMLLEGSELTKEDQESQLYDDFEHFRQNKGETIHDYYVRFAKLINDMQNIKTTMSRMQLNSKFVNNMLPEWGRFVRAVKLNRGLRDSNYDQLYAYLKQHEAHANENKMMLDRFTQHTVDPLDLMSNVSHQQYYSQSSTTPPSTYVPPHFADNTQFDSGLSPSDNLIENLTNTLALLTQSYKTYLPQTNNQLRTSSNPRNQAIVQDGRVVVQNVLSRQNRGQGNNARGAGAAGYRGAQNRIGNANPGQAMQVKYYNCNGIGHIARNCTQPKRPYNSEYFKDKILLMQAQENGVALDEEQLLFIAGGQDNAVDEDVDEQPVQDLAL
ncbi:retrovirus-related pol polyprotein from transposon TNT 1-94 [Tanacetum coccineum]